MNQKLTAEEYLREHTQKSEYLDPDIEVLLIIDAQEALTLQKQQFIEALEEMLPTYVDNECVLHYGVRSGIQQAIEKLKNREVAEEIAKLHLSDVTESVCDNCEPVSGFYLGTTCSKCNRPFRSVKQTVR